MAHGRWNRGASRCELPDPQLRTRRGEASRDASSRRVRVGDKPDEKPRGIDRVCTRLESRGTESARRAVCATSVHVQADSQRDLDPVETVRKPPIGKPVGVKTQSDLGSAEANALSAPPGEYDRKVKTQRN